MSKISAYTDKPVPDGTEHVVISEGVSGSKKAQLSNFPVSDLTQLALDAKAASSHSHTPTEVGLSNVTNDAQLKVSELGVANGVAPLDGANKLPVGYLPTDVQLFLGNWNATTNTPTLADGVGTNGDTYRTSVAGTTDFGAGGITFKVGDYVAYNGTIWEKSINSNEVVSVNSKTSVVVLDTDDLSDVGKTNKFTTQADIDKLGLIEASATADQSASEVPYVANGDIVATDVQAAITEVRDDTDTKLGGKSDTGHIHLAAEVNMPVLGSPTYTTLADQSNIIRSTGVIDGGEIQNNGDGTVKVLAGSGILRATNDLLAELVSLDWAEVPSIALTDQTFNHIYLEYNAGTPQLVSDPANRMDFQTNILLGGVYRDGNEIHLTPQIREDVLDTTKRLIRRFEDTQPFQHANGAILSESGTRNIRCTAGLFKIGLNDVITLLQDTSGASPDLNHTFEYFYNNAGWITHEATVAAAAFTGAGLDDMTSGGTFIGSHTIRIHVEITATGASDTIKWSYKGNDGVTVIETTGVTIVAGPMEFTEGATGTFASVTGHTIGDAWDFDLTLSSQIDNTQYDTGSGLGTLGNGRYGVHWLYTDIHGHLAVRFGEGSYTLAEAEDAPIPGATPQEFEHHSRLIGKVIIRKGEAVFTKIENNYGNAFQAAVTTSHDALADVQGGIASQHFHLSQAELADVQAIEEVLTLAEKNKLGGIELLADVTDATNVDAAGATMNTDSTLVGNSYFLDEDNMISDDATKVPSQQSVKAYVDAAITLEKSYQGGYNAATNTPDLDTTPIAGILKGDVYDVTAAGNFFTEEVEVMDSLRATQDNPTLLSHWTVLQANLTPASIKTQYESNADTNAFTDADDTKLAGIEAGATADQTGAEIKAAYESEPNAFTDTKNTKLAGIETAATADQTGAEIKTALFAEADTNNFDDAAVTSLADSETKFLQLQAGVILAIGDWCYRDEADGKMKKVDATAVATVKGLIAVCTEALAADATGKFQTKGIFTTTGLTANEEYFVSETAGQVTNTELVASGSYIRSIGVAKSTTELYIDVDHTYYGIA